MKGFKGIAIGIMMFALVALCIFSVSHAAQKQPSPTAAPPTATGKPTQAAPALPDLIVERVWLDKEGSIHFQLKNAGQAEIPDREHRQGMVRVTYGKEHEDFSFTRAFKRRPPVDPKGLLKKPGGVVQYNTQIGVTERLTVTVVVDSTKRIAEANEQNNRSTPMIQTPSAVALKGVKEDIAGKMKPKPEGGVKKGVKELHPRTMGLRVRAPNGREFLYKGALYHILWEGGEAEDHIKIELIRPGRGPILIADSVENTYGMYAWLIPDNYSIRAADDYKISITSTYDDSMHDESDENFSIFDIAERILTVNSPNGGETWREGNAYYIHWLSRGIGDRVRVELWDPSRDIAVKIIDPFASNYEGSEYHGLPPTTRYGWTVPHDFLRDYGLGRRYGFKIRICGLSGVDICDESDATFYIEEEPPPVYVALPMVEAESGFVKKYHEDHLPPEGQTHRCSSGEAHAGDDFEGSCYRGLVSFDISGIPRTATISTVILVLRVRHINGNPFADLGDFKILRVNYGMPSVDDYSSSGSVIWASRGQPERIGVTSSVREAHANHRSLWQIRMQFDRETDGDNSNDAFFLGTDSVLQITYQPSE